MLIVFECIALLLVITQVYCSVQMKSTPKSVSRAVSIIIFQLVAILY